MTGRTIRILLVEDSPLMMGLLARALARNSRTLIVGAVADGHKALGYACSLAPDLVITDLHIPGLDGAGATRLLKQRTIPPIVFITTSDDTPEARAKCLAAGADVFLLKTRDLAPQLFSALQEFFPVCNQKTTKPAHSCESLATVE